MEIPVIDLSSAKQDANQLELVDMACRDHGFFLLTNHGMREEIEAMWEVSSRFFSQTIEEKRKLYRTESNPLGYFDKELTKKKRDRKEVFDFMQPRAASNDFNQWPLKDKTLNTIIYKSRSKHGIKLVQRTGSINEIINILYNILKITIQII